MEGAGSGAWGGVRGGRSVGGARVQWRSLGRAAGLGRSALRGSWFLSFATQSDDVRLQMFEIDVEVQPLAQAALGEGEGVTDEAGFEGTKLAPQGAGTCALVGTEQGAAASFEQCHEVRQGHLGARPCRTQPERGELGLGALFG